MRDQAPPLELAYFSVYTGIEIDGLLDVSLGTVGDRKRFGLQKVCSFPS